MFRAFARTVDAATERIVVLDTAPTGHTLLLLDAAQSYQREVQRTNANVPAEVSQLLARLRDPDFARMLLITNAESTPVQEAERLQEDLRRADIEPFGWIINSSLSAAATDHPTLRARAAAELAHIERVQRASAQRTWLVGWQPRPTPVRASGLARPRVGGPRSRRRAGALTSRDGQRDCRDVALAARRQPLRVGHSTTLAAVRLDADYRARRRRDADADGTEKDLP